MADFPKTSTTIDGSRVSPCLRDTGLTVGYILNLLGRGLSEKELVQIHPELTPEDVRQALAYAARRIDTPEPAPTEPCVISSEDIRLPSCPAPLLEPVVAQEAEAQPVAIPDEESPLELYHPAYPHEPTVTVTPDGLYDRRWGMAAIAWSDIRTMKRIRAERTIRVILHYREPYLATMPFFKRIIARLRLYFDGKEFVIDTTQLGVRTKELNALIHRFWMRYRGNARRRIKRKKLPLEPVIRFP